MERIDTITITQALPRVFVGEEADPRIARSEVWLTECVLRRGDSYIIEAGSGTGKTSLCAFMYGSRHDYNGTIRFNGEDTAAYNTARWCDVRRRHLAMLPQDMGLFPELTSMENILIKNRLTDRYTEVEIADMLAALEVDNRAYTRAGLLSVGQQQRVALVRALCQPFDFIILDEPVSHLDERNNAAAARLVTNVAKAEGAGVIVTSVGNPLALEQFKSVRL